MSVNESAWRLKCDGCGKVLSVPIRLAGRQVKCPNCEQAFRVPDAKPTATPLIADFLSDDMGTIESRKKAIRDEEWQRTAMLGAEYVQKKPGKARDGRPLDSWKPCVTSLF